MTTVRKKLFFLPDEKKDYDLRQRWIRFVNREGWKPSKKSCICRKHFELHYYKTGAEGKQYRLIKKLKPVPTIFDPEQSHLSAESKYLKSPIDDDHRTGHPPPHSDVTARWGHHLGHGYWLSLVCCFACCPWLPGFLTFLTFSGHWLLLSIMPTGICLALVMRRLCSTI